MPNLSWSGDNHSQEGESMWQKQWMYQAGSCWMGQHIPLITALRRQMQAHFYAFKVSLVYLLSSRPIKATQKNQHLIKAR